MRPVVGISPCLDERERWRAGREYVYLDHAYAAAVEAGGGRAILVPMQRDPETLVAEIDALLLPGGDDFLPAAPYPADVDFDPVPERQRRFDAALLAAALKQRKPVLGICYGAQLIALQDGGRLHYHIPLDLPDALDHRLPEETGRHEIEAAHGSRLAGILGEGPVPVNSLHHQAIAEVGDGLRVVARSSDGVIEAIESASGEFVLGVQWHPEKLDSPAGHGVICALVEAATRT